MRIVLDIQSCQSESRFRGIGRYSFSLLQAILRNTGKHEILVVANNQLPDTIEILQAHLWNLIPANQFYVFNSLPNTASFYNTNLNRNQVAELIRERYLATLEPDIIHVFSLFEGLIDNSITSIHAFDTQIPTSVILYDLTPLRMPTLYFQNKEMQNWYFRKLQSLKRAELLLSISEFSRLEAIPILNILPEQIVNISSAVDDCFKKQVFSNDTKDRILKRYNITKPFILYTGGVDLHKNVKNLVEAFINLPVALRKSYQLLLVACKMIKASYMDLKEFISQKDLADDAIIFTDFVPDEELIFFYNHCTLFVFPSISEGFGLTVLEAMSCGAPVIASNTSSIPEVINLNDALFDPQKVEAITAKMTQVLTDSNFRSNLMAYSLKRSKDFSWDNCAKKALRALEAMHEQHKSTTVLQLSTVSRPSLAYVSPLPPEKTGIAIYSAVLLRELGKFYNITLITNQPIVEDPWLVANFPIQDTAWFENQVDKFQRIIYHYGNSPFHAYMIPLSQKFPGIIVLHDFYLSSLMHWTHDDKTWGKMLYEAYGYSALWFNKQNTLEETKKSYPCNQFILESANGLIIHSQHAVDMLKKWHNYLTAQDYIISPFPCAKRIKYDKTVAKQHLNFAPTDFLVCSFGFLDSTKLNDYLINAWFSSKLANNKHCQLIFVGENHGGDYGNYVIQLISKHNANNGTKNIHISGYISKIDYEYYLSAADVAIQLRQGSRGETSAAIFDCFSAGLPVIINDHGTSAELPDTIVIKLADNFSHFDLALVLEQVFQNPSIRQDLSKKVLAYIERHHHPAQIAILYKEAIEKFLRNQSQVINERLLANVADIIPNSVDKNIELSEMAMVIAANRPPTCRQLLLDISTLITANFKTGIERTSLNILKELFQNPMPGIRVEPIYTDGQSYRYARSFTLKLLGFSALTTKDSIVEPHAHDIFIGLDWSPVKHCEHKEWLKKQKLQGVALYFIVYDLLPVQLPQFFLDFISALFINWLNLIAEIATGLICISQSVAQLLLDWLTVNPPVRFLPLKIDYFHLGADICSPNLIQTNDPYLLKTPQSALDKETILAHLKARTTCLMVGTVEPRKGYAQALAAFEFLWASGQPINLVIVGRAGWLVKDLLKQLNTHPQKGKQLFWLPGIEDSFLEQIYKQANFFLAASLGEGFGLPLIEASHYNLPILARDIPIFREIAGLYASYFKADTAVELAAAINQWQVKQLKGELPISADMPKLTWKESTARLLNILLADNNSWHSWRPNTIASIAYQVDKDKKAN